MIPTQAISIPLKKVSANFYEGEVTDARAMGASRWLLAIHAKLGEADLIQKTPAVVKFCSAKFVTELVKRALPGMNLSAPVGAAFGDLRQGRVPVFHDQQEWPMLGPHHADAAGRCLCAGRRTRSGAGTAGHHGYVVAFASQSADILWTWPEENTCGGKDRGVCLWALEVVISSI